MPAGGLTMTLYDRARLMRTTIDGDGSMSISATLPSGTTPPTGVITGNDTIASGVSKRVVFR